MHGPWHNQPHRTSSKHSSEDTCRKFENKIEDVLEEEKFGFRRGKGTRGATGMFRLMSEWTCSMAFHRWKEGLPYIWVK